MKTKTAETIEFPSFDTTAAADQFRAFTEKGVEQTKEAYSKFKAGAEEAQKVVESTFDSMKATGTDMSLKSIAAARAHADATFSHMEALVGVRSISEFVGLQTAYLRQMAESATTQAKDFQAASTKAFEDMTKPAKSAFERAMKDMNVA